MEAQDRAKKGSQSGQVLGTVDTGKLSRFQGSYCKANSHSACAVSIDKSSDQVGV